MIQISNQLRKNYKVEKIENVLKNLCDEDKFNPSHKMKIFIAEEEEEEIQRKLDSTEIIFQNLENRINQRIFDKKVEEAQKPISKSFQFKKPDFFSF